LSETGALRVDAETVSIVETGFVIAVRVNRYTIDVVRDIYYDPAVTGNVDAIITAANEQYITVTDSLNGDANQIQTDLATVNEEYALHSLAVTDADQAISTSLDERQTTAETENIVKETASETLTHTTETTSQLDQTLERYIAETTQAIEDRKIALSYLEQQLAQAEAEVSARTRDLLAAKLDALNNPDDTTKQQIWADSEQALRDAVKAALIIREQLSQARSSLEAEVASDQTRFDAITTELQANNEEIKTNTERDISEVRTDFQTKLTTIIEIIRHFLEAYRSTINDVHVEIPDLSADGTPTLTVKVTINDDGRVDESIDFIREIHRLCIRAALILCSQNTAVVVVDVAVSAKRATATQYEATIGQPSVEPTSPSAEPTGEPTSPTAEPTGEPTAPSNSDIINGNPASTFVFSFAVLVAFILAHMF